MFSALIIHRDVVQAYMETDYIVQGDVPLTLRVGIANPVLMALHKAESAESSAFITACNPFSQALDDAGNAERQGALAHELRHCSLKFIDGVGQHPSNQWPGEASFLVLGISLDAAKELGVRYEQNAIIWCGLDAVPQLVLLR